MHYHIARTAAPGDPAAAGSANFYSAPLTRKPLVADLYRSTISTLVREGWVEGDTTIGTDTLLPSQMLTRPRAEATAPGRTYVFVAICLQPTLASGPRTCGWCEVHAKQEALAAVALVVHPAPCGCESCALLRGEPAVTP